METYLSLFYRVLAEHSLIEMLLASLIIFFATVVQVAMGIAFGLIAAPLLAVIDIAFVPVPVLLLTFSTSVAAFWGERKGVKWPELRSAVTGRIIGSIVGVVILSMIPGEKTFMLVFGLIIALAVLFSVSGLPIPFNLRAVGLAGTLSGFTASITGVGGPPMAIVYQNKSAGYARPTLQTFFALGSFFTLCILGLSGQIKPADIMLAFLLLPALFTGFFVGPLTRPFFDKRFRPFLLASAAIASFVLIIRGLS